MEGENIFSCHEKNDKITKRVSQKNTVYDDSEGTMISNPSGLDTR